MRLHEIDLKPGRLNEILINGAYYAINYKIGVNMILEGKQ